MHEGGFTVQRAEDGELRFFTPRGRHLPALPPPLDLPAEPVRELLCQTEHQAPDISPKTGSPTWDGSVPVDYDTAVQWLLKLDKAS